MQRRLGLRFKGAQGFKDPDAEKATRSTAEMLSPMAGGVSEAEVGEKGPLAFVELSWFILEEKFPFLPPQKAGVQQPGSGAGARLH